MKTTATLPDHIAPQAGEEIQFEAIVQADGTLLVTRLLHRELPAARETKTTALGDWARQWAGAMTLEPGQTYEELRRDAYRKRFGL